jgi:nucleoside-diphosphate-sugar epimerase
MRIALTGGTGFVGSHYLDAALAAAHEVTALTRRPQPERDGVTWVMGDLANRPALKQLVEGADAVVHIAGVLTAMDEAAFRSGNVDGTLSVLASATASGAQRFVFVSSLAAREPKLSMYGASKAKAEELVERSGLDWSIVRPPAVYGTGDREMLELFKMARMGMLLMPPPGRFSIIHADDLTRLLLALTDPGAPSKLLVEPDDGSPNGWDHRSFATVLGRAVGRDPMVLNAPAPLLRVAAQADKLLRGARAKLTPDRAAYFSHDNWVVDPAKAPPRELWTPIVQTDEGLAETARWYRRQGWL